MCDLASLECTILHFFTHPNKEAHEQLKSFNSDPFSWQPAFQLLSSTHQSVRLFAANVICTRARTDAAHLKEEHRSLFMHSGLAALHTGCNDIRAPLSLALATIACIPCHPHVLISHPLFSSLSLVDKLAIVAAVGEVTPEYDRDILLSLLPLTESLVRDGLQDGHLTLTLACVEAWSPSGFNLSYLTQCGLLSPYLSVLQQNVSLAAPSFGEICQAQIDSASGSEHAAELFMLLLRTISTVIDLYIKSSLLPDHDEVCIGCSKILVAYGRGFAKCIAERLKKEGKEVIDAILLCNASPNMTVSESSLEFWDDFVYIPDRNDSDYIAERNYIYTQLLRTLIIRCQYPVGFTGWEQTDLPQDDFERFRVFARTVFTYTSWTLGAAVCRVIADHIEKAVTWEGVEGGMYALSCVGPDLAPKSMSARSYQRTASRSPHGFLEASPFLSTIFTAVLPYTNVSCPPLLQTTLEAADACAEWLKSQPVTMQSILVLGLEALQVQGCSEAGGKAIQAVCRTCSDALYSNQMVDSLITASLPYLTYRGSQHALPGLVHLILQGDMNDYHTRIRAVFQPLITSLCDLAVAMPTDNQCIMIQQILDTLSTGVTALEPINDTTFIETCNHPANDIMALCWDILTIVINKYSQDDSEGNERVVEGVFHFYLDSFKVAPSFFMPLAPSMITVILDTFRRTASGCCMDALKELLQILKNEKATMKDLQTIIQAASDLLTSLLSGSITSHEGGVVIVGPPAIEAYYDMMFFAILLKPDAILQWDGLPSVLDLSLNALSLRSNHVSKAVYVFLENLLWRAREESNVVQSWVMKQGEALMVAMVMDVVERGDEDIIKMVGEAMHAFLLLTGDVGMRWLSNALSGSEVPATISLAGRGGFLDQVMLAAPKKDPKPLVVACSNLYQLCHVAL